MAIEWKRTQASWFQIGNSPGACGTLKIGENQYAELGTAWPDGRATGVGWIALLFGLHGELPCGAGLLIRYKSRVIFARKADRGYGVADQLTGTSWTGRAIDLTGTSKTALGFPNGVDTVEIALDRNDPLHGVTGHTGPQPSGLHGVSGSTFAPGSPPAGQGDFANWSQFVERGGDEAHAHGDMTGRYSSRLRDALRHGTRLQSPHGRPHAASFINLHLPSPRLPRPHVPHGIHVPHSFAPSGDRRSRVVDVAYKQLARSAECHYEALRPFPSGSLWDTPWYGDCSQFFTQCYQAAGLPDPNGLGYDGYGNTSTLMAHGRAIRSPDRGDAIFYSYPDHVSLCVGGGQCIEVGGDPCPRKLPWNYRPPIAFRSYFG